MPPEERYDIIKLIHKGRTGGIYQAEDTVLHRQVALRRFYSESGSTDSRHYQDAFCAIAQKLATLQHPGITPTLDAGIDSDGAYLVTELKDGQSLLQTLQNGYQFSETECLNIAQQVLEALQYCHQSNFCHGYLSLSSIFLQPRASGGYLASITDLGLGYLAPLIQGQDSHLASLLDPAMSAPELKNGQAASPSTDLYSCGHLFYTILAGGHPFASLAPHEANQKNSRNLLPLLSDISDSSLEITQWVHSLIQAKPSLRPASIPDALKLLPIPHHATNAYQHPSLTPTAPPSNNNSLQYTGTSLTSNSTSKIPLIILSVLLLACLGIGWKAFQPKNSETQKDTTQTISSINSAENRQAETLPQLTNETAKGRRLLQDEAFSSFSKARSIYAHWYFTPDYFEGQDFDYYYSKRSKLLQPPKFENGNLIFNNKQLGIANKETAKAISREQFTLEAYVRIDKTTANGGIISCSEDSESYSRGFFIGYNLSGNATFKISSSKKTTLLSSHSTPFPSSKWTHIVGVFDTTSLHLYVNGNKEATATHGHKMTMARDTPEFTIGGYKDKDTASAMTGQIQSAAIYKTALSDSEVTELYKLRSQQQGITP